MSEVVEAKTLGEIEDLLANAEFLVLDFAAPSWCVPCQRLAPHYAMAAKKMPDVKFVHINLDEADREVAEVWGIQQVPTVMMYVGEMRKEVVNRTAPTLIREIQENIDANAN